MADTVQTPKILTRAQTIRARVSKLTPELWVNDVLFLLDSNEKLSALLVETLQVFEGRTGRCRDKKCVDEMCVTERAIRKAIAEAA